MISTNVVLTSVELRKRLNLHQHYHLGTVKRCTEEGVWCVEPGGRWRLWTYSYTAAVNAEASHA